MTPEEIIDAYNVLAEDVKNNTATEAARIGNSQRSLGPLAAAVASPSGQTSGLANYTYNRTMRPVVDSMSTKLITTGKAAALENKLSADLRAAKNAYEDAKNAYTVASSLPKDSNGGNKYTEETGTEYKKTDESKPAKGHILKQTPNGDGTWTFDIADGNGGVNSVKVNGKSKEQAQSDYEYNYYSDGTKKSPYAKNDNPAWEWYRRLDSNGHNYVVN